jgi:hypothetical protein
MFNIKAKLSVHTEFGTSQLFYCTINMFRPSWAIIKEFDTELQVEAPNEYKYDNIKIT